MEALLSILLFILGFIYMFMSIMAYMNIEDNNKRKSFMFPIWFLDEYMFNKFGKKLCIYGKPIFLILIIGTGILMLIPEKVQEGKTFFVDKDAQNIFISKVKNSAIKYRVNNNGELLYNIDDFKIIDKLEKQVLNEYYQYPHSIRFEFPEDRNKLIKLFQENNIRYMKKIKSGEEWIDWDRRDNVAATKIVDEIKKYRLSVGSGKKKISN